MGSCVSHCSRQDVVHQQTGRVITDVQKSIEITPGSSLLQKSIADIRDVKDFSNEDNDKDTKNTLSPVKLLTPEPSDVRDQINAEIRALREQLVRSQVVFTYLLKNEENRSKSCYGKNELRNLIEGGNLSDAIFHCKSFDGQVLARFYNRSNRSSSSYTSHRSTPLHCGYTSISCPTLPIDSPVVTKSTQTEPVSGATLYIDNTNSDRIVTVDSARLITKGASSFSPPSTPCETISETFLLSDVCEIHREPENHSFPRHRTNSFLAAVKDGNPKLVDAEFNSNDSSMKQIQSDSHDTLQKRSEESPYLAVSQSSSAFIPSPNSKICELEGKSMTDENKECTFTRKLSVLLEEEYEDSPRNYFSVCSSQPYLNRKRKVSQSCNAKTQTDLTMSYNTTHSQKQPFISKSLENLPITEICYPRRGYTLVSQAVQKTTVHSMELPKKLVLRHPPPYMQKNVRHNRYVSSRSVNFRDHGMKHKSHIHKWATVSESLPNKGEYVHNFTYPNDKSKLQTRHLSLEKQESVSSYDHASYINSRMSSTTDCSGWITKSDVELNCKLEPPSYQESLLASQGSHSLRNRWAWKYVTLVICF